VTDRAALKKALGTLGAGDVLLVGSLVNQRPLARTGDGRQRRQAREVRFGRRRKLTQHQIADALARRTGCEAALCDMLIAVV